MDEPELVSLRECAKRIGVDKGQLAKESKAEGFPFHATGRRKLVKPGEVTAWRALNIRQKQGRDATAMPAATVARETVDDSDPLLIAMRSGNATEVEMLQVAARMCGREIAHAYQHGSVATTKFDALKKTLEELRKAKVAEIDFAKSTGQLIERSTVIEILGACVARLIRAFGIFENSVATEFGMWLADPSMREMSPDQRARVVRTFAQKTAAEVRRLEAEGVEKLIDRQTKGES